MVLKRFTTLIPYSANAIRIGCFAEVEVYAIDAADALVTCTRLRDNNDIEAPYDWLCWRSGEIEVRTHPAKVYVSDQLAITIAKLFSPTDQGEDK